MAPLPVQVFNDRPLRPQHPDGATPQTIQDKGQQEPTKTYVPASTTSSSAIGGPPPPQPGARPTPTTSSTNGPSLPQPGAVPVVTEYRTTTITTQQTPPQFHVPPPTASNLPTKSTVYDQDQKASYLPIGSHDTKAAQLPFPSPVEGDPLRRHSLEHPPSYIQNPYSDGDAASRERRQSLIDNENREGKNEWWSAAKGWVEGAGERLAEAEKGVWRWANSK